MVGAFMRGKDEAVGTSRETAKALRGEGLTGGE